MLMLFLKRVLRIRQFKPIRILTAACILILLVNLSSDSFEQRQPFAPRASITAQHLLPHIKSLYIASVQFHTEEILRAHWVPSLLRLVEELQRANITVYVSIYENHSLDGTRGLLSELALTLKNLNVDHTIYLDTEPRTAVIEKAISSQTGWLQTIYGKELRRTVYLADVRNRALKPLHNLKKAGIEFDKLLFLNDVVFSVYLSKPAEGWLKRLTVNLRPRMRSRF